MDNRPALDRRRAIGSDVAAAYARHPRVAAVLLAGSVARGLADELSDVEVDVFWDIPPSDADRSTPLRDNAWQVVAEHVDEYEWADSFLVRGVKVDTSQFLVATIDHWIDKVVTSGDTEPEYQVRISAIRGGRALHGADLIERWRSCTEAYPNVLMQAMVDQGLDVWPRARMEMLAQRDDVLMLHSDLVDTMRGVLDVLMGLNRIYAPHPWHKWLDWETGLLTVAPADLNRRIRSVLHLPAAAAVDEAVALVLDTLDLVERELPEFDIEPKRVSFAGQRVLHDPQPVDDDSDEVVTDTPAQ